MAAGDADQAFFHEQAQHVAAVNAADRLDVGPHDRLAVGDDGQRFPGDAGQAEVWPPRFKRTSQR